MSASRKRSSSGERVEEAVLAAVENYNVAIKDRDAERQATFFAQSHTGSGRMTKAELLAYLTEEIEQGRDVAKRFVLDDATVIVDEDTAIIDPATLRSPTGGGAFEIRMKREADGVWRCESLTGSRSGHETAETARCVRERIAGDPARPGYHFVVPEGVAMPFDPNGAIYWKGRYHLFYIFQDTRLGRKADHWGHVSSTDLLHWVHHPTGLLDGMYSGNCFINKDGVPTICYHQKGLGNALAVALDDDLNEWQKLESNPITPHTQEGDLHHGRYKSWDPFGWLDGDTYYAIFGGGRPGVAKSPALDGEWRYVGDLFAHGVEGVSLDEDVSCADLFALGDKDVLLCISHRLGCRYYLGVWKDEQFHPESHAQMSWIDHSFFAPESLVDDKGRRIMWAWIMDEPQFGVRSQHGWSGTMSLPRELTLDDNGQLGMDVPEEIKTLRQESFRKADFHLPADTDVAVAGVGGNSLELSIEMEGGENSAYGVKVCVSPDGQEETSIFYDAREKRLKVDTLKSGPHDTPKAVEAGPLELKPDERLKLRVFVDRSVVEVFANGRQAVARRIYPARPDSVGVRVFSRGAQAHVHTFEAWEMTPANAS
ncbi:MAG: GH32 C-terminal domain-containing protein [Gammaproteobacteria bacterium]|nr:GH32 C-terminal domain-containing protein [Gammaproteobacteria bacterium]